MARGAQEFLLTSEDDVDAVKREHGLEHVVAIVELRAGRHGEHQVVAEIRDPRLAAAGRDAHASVLVQIANELAKMTATTFVDEEDERAELVAAASHLQAFNELQYRRLRP